MKAIQTLTLETFLRLPNIEESPAWEFIGGEMLQKPMPTTHHSILQKRLVAAIDQADSQYEAFPELRCVLSQQSVVPDVAVILDQRVPSENGPVQGAPDSRQGRRRRVTAMHQSTSVTEPQP